VKSLAGPSPTARALALRAFIVAASPPHFPKLALWVTAACTSALMACGPSEASAGPLIEPTAWVATDDSEDPFFEEEQPATSVCDSFGNGVEDLFGEQVFFVNTAACAYLTVVQPALRNVGAGATLEVRLHHFELTSERPASGHAAIATDAGLLWEYNTEIPAPERTLDETVMLDAPIEKGDSIYFHVHNHGPNEWALVELSVQE
jgi:hypothetical protein